MYAQNDDLYDHSDSVDVHACYKKEVSTRATVLSI